MSETVKSLEVVAIINELEEQEQFTELVNIFNKGFTNFRYIGGGIAILSKEELTEIPFRVEKEICTRCRFGSNGDKVTIPVNDEMEFSLHIFEIKG